MKSTNDLIFEKITNSAKVKFDYETFEAKFGDIPATVPDMVLLEIICGFASDDSIEVVTAKALNQILMIGLFIESAKLQKVIEDIKPEIKIEIGIANMAINMLDDGADPNAVLEFVNKMLQ